MENTFAGEKTIGDSISLEILTSNTALPALPANGTKLLDMAQQPMDKIDIASFARLVEMDPALFTSVLQLANSPYYSGVDKIISLRAAITRIGLGEAINSVCLYFLQKMVPKFPVIAGVSSKNCWAYAWACATANRRLGHPNLEMGVLPGELYLTGLLHGMGKLLMAIHYPDEFSRCVTLARDHKQPLHKMELDVFGTTDAFVAAKIMETWNLPPNICRGVAFHQMPEAAPEEYKEIAGITQLAYWIAARSGIGTSGDGCLIDFSSCYLCQQPHIKISQEEIREPVISEILTALAEKSESVTGLPSVSAKKAPGKLKSKDTNLPNPLFRMEKRKKTLFERIRTLFQ